MPHAPDAPLSLLFKGSQVRTSQQTQVGESSRDTQTIPVRTSHKAYRVLLHQVHGSGVL